MIVLQTNHGDITIALNHEKAPATAANFEQYVRDGFYDGTLFHRVIDGFMIQGGGFDQEFNQKPTRDPIENEADNGLQNTIGTLAMARTQDPHSATAQFFINVGNNSFLNHSGKSLQGWGYAVFGEVVDGMNVVNAIKAVSTTRRGMHADVPAEDVVIERAYLKDAE
ncbi:peptidylprolyl isomerase [Halomonas sp. C22]|uniref:peptidylprolyl isomerase n=1 Tax=Halomonas sp. C22 TaxID=2580567 RepID=UPI00119E92D7|nr:peptidylprolyl isomerase [Halomonas sp. C22]